jgi:hypothetical protein
MACDRHSDPPARVVILALRWQPNTCAAREKSRHNGIFSSDAARLIVSLPPQKFGVADRG